MIRWWRGPSYVGLRWGRNTKYIYENNSICPFVRIGTPPPPLHPEPKGGHTCLWVRRGWGGGPNSDDWRKSLALCVLCGKDCVYIIEYEVGGDSKHRLLGNLYNSQRSGLLLVSML
jgi:hypothetical protein